eukprot:SAG11_NODE_7442_length_1143_cov_1.487548_2_plen_44_part_01
MLPDVSLQQMIAHIDTVQIVFVLTFPTLTCFACAVWLPGKRRRA